MRVGARKANRRWKTVRAIDLACQIIAYARNKTPSLYWKQSADLTKGNLTVTFAVDSACKQTKSRSRLRKTSEKRAKEWQFWRLSFKIGCQSVRRRRIGTVTSWWREAVRGKLRVAKMEILRHTNVFTCCTIPNYSKF
jgi:hypothetical protein